MQENFGYKDGFYFTIGLFTYIFWSNFDTLLLLLDNLDWPQFQSGNPKKEHLFKVLVIGDLGVGKTSFIKRYVHQFFSVHYRATVGDISKFPNP